MCTAEKGTINCPSDAQLRCNDAGVKRCKDVDFCPDDLLDQIKMNCKLNEATYRVSPDDFDCMPYACEGECLSRYTVKGEPYEIDDSKLG